MTQVRQGVRSTEPKGIVTKQQPEDKEPEPDGMEPPDNDSGNNLIVKVSHQSKLYTDDARVSSDIKGWQPIWYDCIPLFQPYIGTTFCDEAQG